MFWRRETSQARSKYPMQYSQEIKRNLQKNQDPVQYSQATKRVLQKKSPDKNALCNVPRGQKGVCKNKSPDQITLYNNFVQLSERSNCASDHFKRNLIFLAKFSNKIS